MKNTTVKFNQIHANFPFNVRTIYKNIPELAESIKTVGLLQPLVVCRNDGKGGGFNLIAGFRRYSALELLKMSDTYDVPVIVKEITTNEEADLANLAENANRKDIHPADHADRLRLVERGDPDTNRVPVSRKKIAQTTGFSTAHIGNLIRCASKLDPKIMIEWRKKDLPLTFLLGICPLPHDEQLKALEKFLTKEKKARGAGKEKAEKAKEEVSDEGPSAPSKTMVRAKLSELQEKRENSLGVVKTKSSQEEAIALSGEIRAIRWTLGEISRL